MEGQHASPSTSMGRDLYTHMPILRPHAARYIANVFKFHEWRISSVKITSAYLYGNVRVRVARALAEWSDLGLPGDSEVELQELVDRL